MAGQRSSSGGSMAGCDMNESIFSPSRRTDESPVRATNGLIVFSWGRGALYPFVHSFIHPYPLEFASVRIPV